MPSVIEAIIDSEKSFSTAVRGVVIVDGIKIPFTAYRLSRIELLGTPNFTGSDIRWDRVAVRSKSGILSKCKDGSYIKKVLRNKAIGWWVDQGLWR